MSSKAELRKTMLEKRAALSPAEYAAACGYLCDKLLTVTLREGASIAGYSAIRGEVDIAQVLNHYHSRNHPIYLPTVTKPETSLKFLKWSPNASLRPGAHGIPEPQGGEVGLPQVLLVPLLAFDRSGHRLGYGAGHYDATIEALRKNDPQLITIGVAFSFQEVDKLPHEAHDERLDMIVTDKEVIRV